MPSILVVDDEPTDIFLVNEILTDNGYRVFAASSGTQGLEMARSHQPDLMLLDLNMPDMDGLTVLQSLKSEPLTRNIPVIMLTASGQSSNLVKGLQLGADEYIAKPIRDERELAARIGTVLRIRSSEAKATRLAQQLQALQGVAVAMNQGLDLSSTLETVVRSTILLGGFDWAGLVLEDGNMTTFSEGVQLEAQQLLSSETMRHFRTPRQIVLVNDVEQVGGKAHTALKRTGIGSYIRAPIISGDETQGALFALCHSAAEFSDEQVQAVEGIAMHAAIAIGNARLYQRIKTLEEAKTQMLNMASHDLRNPLTIAINSLSILTEDLQATNTLSDEQGQLLGLAQRGLFQMEALIEDILTTGRIEALIEQGPQPVEIEEVVQQVVTSAQLQAMAKGQKLSFFPSRGSYFVRGYVQPLREAVANLISNAVKYTPPGGTIRVTIQANNREVQIEVQDNGIGIPEDKQARLFEPFYRAHQPGAEDIAGTGLGLSMVKQVAEQHGGHVWVRSALGEGSTFGIVLPCAEAGNDVQNHRPAVAGA